MPSDPPPIAPEALLRHADFIRRLVRPLLADETAVDDVAQDTWMSALDRRPSQADSLKAWLGSIARRLALRKLRSDERRARRERAAARAEAGDGAPPSAAHELLLENVTRAVLDLAEPYRRTVLMRYFEGLGPGEIARRTGVPVATVSSRLQRAHARIRDRLDRDADGGRRAWSAALSSFALSNGVLVMSSSLKVALGVLVVAVGVVAALSRAPGDLASVPDVPRAELPAVPIAEPVELEEKNLPAQPSLRVATTSEIEPEPVPAWTKAPTGSLLLSAVREGTGLPVVGRVYDLFPWGGDEPFAEMIERVTDHNGEIHVEEIAAGDIMVYGRFGGGGRTTIEAGAVTEYEIVVPSGMHVSGRVVDAEGKAIDDARIWLSDRGNSEEGAFVGEADAWGQFELPDVRPSCTIAAFAAGYAPSTPQLVEGNVGEAVEVRLELTSRGGAIHGVVTDAEGEVIGGGEGRGRPVVQVEPRKGGRWQQPDGSWAHEFGGYKSACDDRGRFELTGLPLESVRLRVRAPGYAPFAVELTPRPEGHREVITLHPAGVVFGTITNGEGRPLAGVRVLEGPYGSFESSFARTRPDGSYRLANLPLGAVELLAEDAELGRASVELELVPGEPVEWSPVLANGLALVGKVVDDSGGPRVGFTVAAIGSKADPETRRLWSDQVRTSADGSFQFANCPDEEVRVEVHDTGYVQVDTLRGIHPGGEPLTIVISDAQLPSASVRGTVVDWEGRPVGGKIVLLGPDDTRGYRSARSELGTGDFAVRALPPGKYSMRLVLDDLPGLSHERIELAQDERLDIGEWWLPPPCRVEIAVAGHAGAGPYDEVVLMRQKGAGWGPPIQFGRDEVNDMLVWPGRYLLKASGPDVCLAHAELDAVPDEPVVAQLEPRAGVLSTFVVRTSSAGSEGLGFLVVSIVDEDRKRSAAVLADLMWGKDGMTFTRRLPPGNFSAVVRGRGTELVRVPFAVSDANVRIELPLP